MSTVAVEEPPGLLKHKDQSPVSPHCQSCPLLPRAPFLISTAVSSLPALALQGRCCPSPRKGWCLQGGHGG